MYSRARRFFGCVAELENTDRRDSRLAPSGTPDWNYYEKAAHPIDGFPMAFGRGSRHRVAQGAQDRHGLMAAAVVTAVRVGTAVEVGMGIDLEHTLHVDARAHLLPRDGSNVGFIPCPETSPAYRRTCQVRVGWGLASTTTAPGVVKYRGTPMIGKRDEHLLYLGGEMPTGWVEGVSERNEAAVTGRTAPFAATDTVTFGVPWLHEHGELLITFPIEKIRLAARYVASIVAPPAPTE